MRALSIFLLLFFVEQLSFAAITGQEEDSLLNVIQTAEDDSIKYATVVKVAFDYVFSNTDEFLPFLKPHINSVKEEENNYFLCDFYNTMGIYYAVTGQKDSAIYYYNASYELSDQYNFMKLKPKVVNNLGMFYWNSSELNKALEYFYKALEINNQKGGSGERSNSTYYSNIGLIYQDLKQYDKAIDYHHRALKLRIKYDEVYSLSKSYNNLGICHKVKGVIDSAEYYYSLGYDLALRNENAQMQKSILCNLGNLYQQEMELSEAIIYYEKAVAIPTETYGMLKSDMVAYVGLLAAFNSQGNLQGSKNSIEKIQEIIADYPEMKLFDLDYYRELAEYHFRKGDPTSGADFLSEFLHLRDSIFSDENAKEVAELEVLYDTKEKERQILEERAKAADLELKNLKIEKELAKNRSLILAVLVLLLVVVVVGLIFYYRKKKLLTEQKNREILKVKDENIQAIIMAQEMERRRIAKDIHDGLMQEIVALKLQLANDADPVMVNQKLNEIAIDARNIAYQMMPVALERNGFIHAVKDLFSNTLKGEVGYQINEPEEELELTDIQALNLYRVIQESLNNIVKHSQAKFVDFSIKPFKNSILFILEDDGVGFDNEKTEKGIGLKSMESRIELLHGTFEMTSEVGEGTITTIRIQYDSSGEE